MSETHCSRYGSGNVGAGIGGFERFRAIGQILTWSVVRGGESEALFPLLAPVMQGGESLRQGLVKRPVTFLAEFCGDCSRGSQWCRYDVEIDSADAVLHLRSGIAEYTAELLGRVVEIVDGANRGPLDLERNNRWDRRSEVSVYRILEVQKILHWKVVHLECCSSCVQVNLDIAWVENSRPEEAILLDSRIEVVDLGSP